MMTSLPKSCPKIVKPNTCIAEDTCIAVTSAGLMVPKVKIAAGSENGWITPENLVEILQSFSNWRARLDLHTRGERKVVEETQEGEVQQQQV